MIEQIDRQLFLFLNSANSPFWDKVMYFMSMKLVWVPAYLLILIAMGIIYKRKLLIIILFIIISVLVADQLSVLLKNSVGRLRPCHDPSLQGLVHLVNGECGGIYGFVSSHAANMFNVALFSLVLIGRRWFSAVILIWAAVISYSRIYLGVHYPGDVLCGAMLGASVGWTCSKTYLLFDRRILQHKQFFS